jgi:hypothetical protein
MTYETIDTPIGALPIRYGNGAIIELERLMKLTFMEIVALLGRGSMEATAAIILAGLRSGALQKRTECTLTLVDVANMMDDDLTLAERCVTLFSESLPKAEDTGNVEPPVLKAAKPKKQ